MTSMDEDKKRILDNINYFLSKKHMKIGELEVASGVSPGYVSRLSKEKNSKPSFEFIKNLANACGTTIDKMTYFDFTNATPTELYLYDFLAKLDRDTEARKLKWGMETSKELYHSPYDENFNVMHPLLKFDSFSDDFEDGDSSNTFGVGFCSYNFGLDTVLNGNSYYLRLKNGLLVYLMSIRKAEPRANGLKLLAVEVWMVTPEGEKRYLSSSLDTSSLGHMTHLVYQAVQTYMMQPILTAPYKSAIDAFMVDDLGDDLPEKAVKKEETHGNG